MVELAPALRPSRYRTTGRRSFKDHEAPGDGALGSPRRAATQARVEAALSRAAGADVRENLLDHPLGQDVAALEARHARQRHLTPVLRPDALHVQRDRSSTQWQSRHAMAPPARRPLRPLLAPRAGQLLDFFLDEVRERFQSGADDKLRECRLRVGGQLQRRSKPSRFRQSLRSAGRSCSDLHGRLLSPRGVSSYSHSRPSEGSRPSSHFQHDPGHPRTGALNTHRMFSRVRRDGSESNSPTPSSASPSATAWPSVSCEP